MKRRDFIKSGVGLLGSVAATGPASIGQVQDTSSRSVPTDELPRIENTASVAFYEAFKNPPRQYTLNAFWFWNGKMDAAEVNRQIEEFVDKGIYGAFMDSRRGLQTPFLSEEWWSVVGAALKRSKELGFHFNVNDEDEWPTGEVRDPWLDDHTLAGNRSRVIAQNHDFRRRNLFRVERLVTGPTRLKLENLSEPECAVAARWLGDNRLDGGSLEDISAQIRSDVLNWEVPPGQWLVIVFCREWTKRVPDHVDLLNPEAVRAYLDLFFGEFYRRFSEYFGSTVSAAFCDHEGPYGSPIAWTPKLFTIFREQKGYDLRKHLPLLVYDGGKLTEKLRCDYLDVISELYCAAFFRQETKWCEAHGIKLTGHNWEEALQWNPRSNGDLYRIERSWSIPGIDALLNSFDSATSFMEVRSVAHFRKTRFFCENQGLQGWGSYLDPQKMRQGTNMIGFRGVNMFCAHGFNYDKERITCPQDWFYHQPYWPYMKQYADYTRRISYMNDGGRHVADIVLYYPLETSWALAEPFFAATKTYGLGMPWPNALPQINKTYQDLKNLLADEGWDYDVVDSYFLEQTTIKERHLVIADEAYAVLILPPMTTIRRESVAKVRQFFEQGGTVIAIDQLPAHSAEEGRDDPWIAQQMVGIFGTASPSGSSLPINTNGNGGQAYFVRGGLSQVTQILPQLLKKDVRVLCGDPHAFHCLHWVKENHHVYWVVNNTEYEREVTARFSVEGAPERWDATTGRRQPLYYRNAAGETEVRLKFSPWDAYYVVFPPENAGHQTAALVRTNLTEYGVADRRRDSITVNGWVSGSESEYHAQLRDGSDLYAGRGSVRNPAQMIWLSPKGWHFTLEKERISLPIAKVHDDPENFGERAGWHLPEFNDRLWQDEWTSFERLTARDWWVVGPFENDDHAGYGTAYPPEQTVNLLATYPGKGERKLNWIPYRSAERHIDLDRALSLPKWPARESPGGTSDSTLAEAEATCYAFSYIYSPQSQRAQLRITPDNNAKAWLNGDLVFAIHDHSDCIEMRDAFAYSVDANLREGWNEILLKVNRAERPVTGIYGFLFRVADQRNRNLAQVIYGAQKLSPDEIRKQQQAPAASGSRWYRWHIPAGTRGVQLWDLAHPYEAYVNGQKLLPSSSGSDQVMFPNLDRQQGNVLALRLNANEVVPDAVEFLVGPSYMTLGSWTFMDGLSHYSGRATYETTFNLPLSYEGKQWILECGEVGSAAEVWVNDKPAGTRIWEPFSFNIAPYVRAGTNRLKIRVANTMSNSQAGPLRSWDLIYERYVDWREQLQQIDRNGLLGPVRIIPWAQVKLVCLKQ